jgi:hypothetical protein
MLGAGQNRWSTTSMTTPTIENLDPYQSAFPLCPLMLQHGAFRYFGPFSRPFPHIYATYLFDINNVFSPEFELKGN